MPELPEVETIRQDLRHKILSKKIIDLQILYTKVAGGNMAEIKSELIGTSFDEVGRIGKLLIFHLKRDGWYALVHLKMTGQLIYRIGDNIIAGGHSMSKLQTELPDKHTQFIITFEDGSNLYFNDQRRFGYLKIVDQKEIDRIRTDYGIEPLTPDFTLKNFEHLVGDRKMILKAFLLNQKLIAGIGNIYADEIAHAARLKPTRRLSTLTTKDVRILFECIQKILAKAIVFRGTTFNNYVDSDGNTGNFSSHLKVYERAEERCDHCPKGIITKSRVAGRGTYSCESCQK